jgi:hypothetical protein
MFILNLKNIVMATAKFLTSIMALRKKYPKSLLGLREKDILFSVGAKVTQPKSLYKDGVFRVKAGRKTFDFTYGKKNYKDFTVIG